MKSSAIIWIVIASIALIVVLALAGRLAMGPSHLAGQTAAQGTPQPPVATTSPSMPTAPGAVGTSSGAVITPAPVSPPVLVTQADSGKTLTLKVGSRFLLELGADQQWTVNISDMAIVRRVPNIMVVRGAQGVYDILAPGVTTLAADGRAICSAGEACPQYVIHFVATIDAVQ